MEKSIARSLVLGKLLGYLQSLYDVTFHLLAMAQTSTEQDVHNPVRNLSSEKLVRLHNRTVGEDDRMCSLYADSLLVLQTPTAAYASLPSLTPPYHV
jgi:hypothetical protein